MNLIKKYMHYIIGFAIMFAIRLIPISVFPADTITPVGLTILGIFIGTIYLWSTVDPLTSSLIAIVMVGFSGVLPITSMPIAGGPDVLPELVGKMVPNFFQTTFGGMVAVQMLFLMIFMAGLTNRGLTAYIGRWLLTRKFVEGKPWVFTAVVCFSSYIMAVFVGAFAPIFLFWPILYGVFKDVGFKKDDKYVKMILIGVVVSTLVGFPVPPYMANGLALLNTFRGQLAKFPELAAMEGVMVSDASYFIAAFTFGILEITVLLLVMKFIIKPDVKPLKEITIEMLNKNPLPPMNKAQKTYGIGLIVFIAIMLVPSLLAKFHPFFAWVNQRSALFVIALVLIMCVIRFEDGPVLRMGPTMGEFAWPTYWLCMSAMLLGEVLTSNATGIKALLAALLGPIFNGMTPFVFTIVIMLVSILLTNISNSLVIGMILQPIILNYCAATGTNPAPIISIGIVTVLSTAACTPAASPFAAMQFGNKEWLNSGDIYKYATLLVVFELILIVTIGIPYFNLIIG